MVSRIIGPKDARILISGPVVLSTDKAEGTLQMRIRLLSWGEDLAYLGGPLAAQGAL